VVKILHHIKKILSRSGKNRMANNSAYFNFIFVICWKTICCSGHEKLVVFVGEQLLYLLML
jgi:hypothetical protein